MKPDISEAGNPPVYRQLVNFFIQSIQSGAYAAGYRLPTVRELASERGLSRGTVKHAYDCLEQLGYIEKFQGRGTFVSSAANPDSQSRKELAMQAIGDLLGYLEKLKFSARDIRIFIDLKLREREATDKAVRIAAVDCCPEALHSMCKQISRIPNVEVYDYLLGHVTASPALSLDADIVVTTPTHFEQLLPRLKPDQYLARIVMALSPDTIMELARIPENSRVGLICSSERFAEIITNTCNSYGALFARPRAAYFGSFSDITRLLSECDTIILPADYLRFASAQERELIEARILANPPIRFQYQIEKGSFLYLEEQAGIVYRRLNA